VAQFMALDGLLDSKLKVWKPLPLLMSLDVRDLCHNFCTRINCRSCLKVKIHLELSQGLMAWLAWQPIETHVFISLLKTTHRTQTCAVSFFLMDSGDQWCFQTLTLTMALQRTR
jgi:hypothetical protein